MDDNILFERRHFTPKPAEERNDAENSDVTFSPRPRPPINANRQARKKSGEIAVGNGRSLPATWANRRARDRHGKMYAEIKYGRRSRGDARVYDYFFSIRLLTTTKTFYAYTCAHTYTHKRIDTRDASGEEETRVTRERRQNVSTSDGVFESHYSLEIEATTAEERDAPINSTVE